MTFYRKHPVISLCMFYFIILELLSFCSYHLVFKQYFFIKQIGQIDYDSYFAKVIVEKQGTTADWYNKKLGWVPAANSQSPGKNCLNEDYVISYGEYSQRLNPAGVGKAIKISTYGDSFTEGEEVNDDKTIQYYLSLFTDTNVSNYGVGAYGVDQALLRLEDNLKNKVDQPEVVILLVFTENVKRILGSYRPFLYRNKYPKLTFKPRFYQSAASEEIVLIENPLSMPFSAENLTTAYDIAKKYDYWFQVNAKRQKIRFPYCLTMPIAFCEKLIEYKHNLWDAEGKPIMDEILARYITLSEKYKFKPVICFLPTEKDVKNFNKGKNLDYQGYVHRIRSLELYRQAIIIDMLEEKFDLTKYYLGGADYTCHCSSYGNQVIAASIFKRLDWKETSNATGSEFLKSQ